MSTFNEKTGEFDFELARDHIILEVEGALSPTEKMQLRTLAEEGGPLWLVQKVMLDYAAVIERKLAGADLDTERGIIAARLLQAEGRAVNWQYQFWTRILSDPTVGKQTEEPRND